MLTVLAARVGNGPYSDYREEYEGQERRGATRLPEAVEIRSSNGRAEADPLNRDLGFWLVREP